HRAPRAGVGPGERCAGQRAAGRNLAPRGGPSSHREELPARPLRSELLRIWQQARKPVMFVTHNALEAVYLADQVLILSGRPATIQKSLRVSLPRDREMEDPRLVMLQREILDGLGITGANGSSLPR